jgi:hypothetical protein
LEEVAGHAGQKALMKVDYILLIVVNPQRISGQQLRTRPIHISNIIMIYFYIIIKLLNLRKDW